ncbi:MAG: chemotaxis protein CheB [Vulcanimicrobiaceae bacterium]
MIRVLLAEDSAVQREFLSYVLETAETFEIVGKAVDGAEAIKLAGETKPDVILMDCHMPKVDGIEATRIIMETCPVPIVVASARSGAREVQLTFDAIQNGALAVVSKPPSIDSPDFDHVTDELIRTLRLMSDVKVVRRWPRDKRSPAARERPRTLPSTKVIVVAGSTGAPGVMAEILRGLGRGSWPPILLVQHIAQGFVEGFALWLASHTGIEVKVAADSMTAMPGCVYIAPDGAQMSIERPSVIKLDNNAPAEDGFCPSGTFLLRSAARNFGRLAMGIVLTGMGRDGVAGLVELQRAGAVTVAQDEESCVVFGMSKEAIEANAAVHVLAPDGIVNLIKDCSPTPLTRT